MALSNVRIGNPTSSDIVSLTKSGKANGSLGVPFFTYVEECRMERFFKQRLDDSAEAFPLDWGKLCEKRVHDLIGDEFKWQADETQEHKIIKGWYGTPDGSEWKTVLKVLTMIAITDVKCPSTRKSFYKLICQLYDFDGITAIPKDSKKIDYKAVIDWIRDNHPDGEKFYWQCVSNACITDVGEAKLIPYMPYFEELAEIKLYNTKLPDGGFYSVERKAYEELPYILKESGINNVNIIPFKIPAQDKQFLEMRVRIALELISLSQADYDELKNAKIVDEKLTIDFIKIKTGEEITHVKAA